MMLLRISAASLRIVTRLAPIGTIAIAAAIGLMMSQTWVGYFEPIQIQNLEARAFVDDYGTTVIYTSATTVNKVVDDDLTRTVKCSGNIVYESPTVRHNRVAIGIENTTNKFMIPFRLHPGTNCVMTTSSRYRPMFSLKDHFYQVPDISFIVETAK